MGTNIKCSLNRRIFITFNPGYAARQEKIVIPFVKTLWITL